VLSFSGGINIVKAVIKAAIPTPHPSILIPIAVDVASADAFPSKLL
jgi:hypothetical protein